jgi:hypothetical protein
LAVQPDFGAGNYAARGLCAFLLHRRDNFLISCDIFVELDQISQRLNKIDKTRELQSERGFVEFASHCDRISRRHFSDNDEEARIIMSAQHRRRIRVAAYFVLLIAAWSLSGKAAHAADCLAAPNSPAPQNSHWYYRTDRAQQRKCWHLGGGDQPLQQGAVLTSRESALTGTPQSDATASPYSLAAFKNFIASRGGSMSNEDVEKLYAQFLEWNRGAKN